MDWRRRPGLDPTDPNGVADLLSRACELEDGGAVQGTRFLFRTADMVSASRVIERRALLDASIPLYVGTQTADRLDAQDEIYASLLEQGVDVYAFGAGEPPELDVRWTEVDGDPLTLAASWFVVRGGDQPEALVGFELGGRDGRRRWEGFRSHDPRLVQRMVDHLRSLVDSTVDA